MDCTYWSCINGSIAKSCWWASAVSTKKLDDFCLINCVKTVVFWVWVERSSGTWLIASAGLVLAADLLLKMIEYLNLKFLLDILASA